MLVFRKRVCVPGRSSFLGMWMGPYNLYLRQGQGGSQFQVDRSQTMRAAHYCLLTLKLVKFKGNVDLPGNLRCVTSRARPSCS